MSKNNKTIKTAKENIDFKKAVEGTPDITKGFCVGLRALRKLDKGAVMIKDNSKADGSVDIDKQTVKLYPDDCRWDYAIGYDSKIYFVEVHPANSSNVSEMKGKRTWLLNWLKTKAPLLQSLPPNPPCLLWAATSAGVHILKTSTEYRQASQMNLIPQRPIIIG